eukprot:jgi/Hompol1/6610/HPOL_000960-RA
MSSKTIEKEKQYEAIVVTYLRKQNRPYSATDIFTNLKGSVQKTALAKALAACVEQNLIRSKTYGKQIIYSPIQEAVPTEPSEEDATDVINQLESAKNELATVKESLRLLTLERNALTKTLPTDELKKAVAKITSELQERLDAIQSGQSNYTPEECARITSRYTKLRVAWQARQNMFNRVWEQVTDGSPNAAQLMVSGDESL